MKIITQSSHTRNCLAAVHCIALFIALSFVGMQLANWFETADPQFQAMRTGAEPPGSPAQRLILKSSGSKISDIISYLELLSGEQVELVRTMSDDAFVVTLDDVQPDKVALAWIEQLTETGLIAYGQLDSPVQINATGAGIAPLYNMRAADPFSEQPNDELYPDQWMMGSPADSPSAINVEKAWEITTGSSDVVVAVIDTGILLDHPDLNNRLLQGYDFVSALNDAPETVMPVHSADNYLKSNDGDGRDLDPSDPGDGVDLAFQEYMLSIGYDCPLVNSTWHGTAMASLLAANGNDSIGMTGVDWQLNVLPVRAIGRCGGNRSDLLDAIRWAAGVEDTGLPPNPNPARIINLSLGIDDVCGPADQRAINDAVNAGAIIVAAVGNHGRDTDEVPSAPADCRHVIGVSSVTSDGSRASYSNFGDDADIAAPGGDTGVADLRKVVVAANQGTTERQPGSSHRYTTGTSVAVPMVSGVLSLMLSVNPALNNAQLESLLYSSTRPFMFVGGGDAQCRQSICGAGMLDAHSAVLAAQDAVDNPPEVAAAVVSDNFIITTGSENFGCTIATTRSQRAGGPAPDPIWLLLIAAAYLLRVCTVRYATVRQTSRKRDVA